MQRNKRIISYRRTKQLILLFSIAALFYTPAIFAQKQTSHIGDSATITFKNVSKDSIRAIHAIIMDQWVAFGKLSPGDETPPVKIGIKTQGLFRFSVYQKDLEDKDTIDPMDYLDNVSPEKLIKAGVYCYTFDYTEEGLHVELHRIQ